MSVNQTSRKLEKVFFFFKENTSYRITDYSTVYGIIIDVLSEFLGISPSRYNRVAVLICSHNKWGYKLGN